LARKTDSGLISLLDSDEYCPHCDNHFVIEALEPQAKLHVEGDDARMDNRYVKHFGYLSDWQDTHRAQYA
jgi:hypothetical protein